MRDARVFAAVFTARCAVLAGADTGGSQVMARKYEPAADSIGKRSIEQRRHTEFSALRAPIEERIAFVLQNFQNYQSFIASLALKMYQ